MTAFLRWMGGKVGSVQRLHKLLPPDIAARDYFEPFLGAGSLFFALRPRRAVLSDVNNALVQTYQAVRAQPREIVRHLEVHSSSHGSEYYYEARRTFNELPVGPTPRFAALFIYLNKTCYGGIWRVNQRGEFNVPFGNRKPYGLPTESELLDTSQLLKQSTLLTADFRCVVRNTNSNSFVYLDPPYPPANKRSEAARYSTKVFAEEDHSELASLARHLSGLGAQVMISNLDDPKVRKWYLGFSRHTIATRTSLAIDGTRTTSDELVILNYSQEDGSILESVLAR